MAEKAENVQKDIPKELGKRKDIKDIINKYFNSIVFVIFLGILIFIKTLLFYSNTIGKGEEIELETILVTLSFIIDIVCFLCLLPNRARIVTGVIVNFLLSLLLFGDEVYYIYSNSVLSIAQFTNLQYGNEILNTLPELLEAKQILYFIDIIIIIILLLTGFLKIKKVQIKSKAQFFVKFVIGITVIIFLFIIEVAYVEKGKEKSYNKDMQIRKSTIFGYHIYDIKDSINIQKETKYKKYDDMLKDYEELKEFYKKRYGKEKYDFKGILKDKNVIILQLESVQEFVINKEINGKQITPNLNQFLKENIEFNNMHMQSYSTTADSEHSTITSLYPLENGMSFSKYYTNKYDDIFNIFNRANYYTSYIHGNDAGFWNRGNVYGKLNVNDLALKDKFDDKEYINGFMSDEVLYTQAVEKMEKYKQPFLSFIVSASSHTPFELEGLQDRSKVNIDVGKYKNSYFGNYLEAVNYADYAFGVLINDLKEKGLYENTAIIVFGDHNGLNMYNEEMIEFLENTNPDFKDIDIKLNYTRVVCGMRIPEIGKLKIEKPVSKLDIKPTLAYLCGIEDGLSLGTNMFSSKEFVSLNNERIIGTNYYYDEDWYDIKTGEQIDINNIEGERKKVLEQYYNNMKTELEISNSIIINNLLNTGYR